MGVNQMGQDIDTINRLQMELEQLRRFKSIGYAGQFPDVVYRAISIEQQRIADQINTLRNS
jgi:FtsZ-binding cell division protein ZapB